MVGCSLSYTHFYQKRHNVWLVCGWQSLVHTLVSEETQCLVSVWLAAVSRTHTCIRTDTMFGKCVVGSLSYTHLYKNRHNVWLVCGWLQSLVHTLVSEQTQCLVSVWLAAVSRTNTCIRTDTMFGKCVVGSLSYTHLYKNRHNVWLVCGWLQSLVHTLVSEQTQCLVSVWLAAVSRTHTFIRRDTMFG